MARYRVAAYEPSTAEQRWHAAIRTHNPITCRPWHLGGALGSLVDAERQELERPAPSHVLFAHNEDHNSQFRAWLSNHSSIPCVIHTSSFQGIAPSLR